MGYGRSNIEAYEYAETDRLALEFLRDYNIFEFPIDVFEIARKHLNAKIVPYSSLSEEKRASLFSMLSEKKCTDIQKGFTVFENMTDKTSKHIIYYNDSLDNNECRYTIAHETKHILCGESNPTQKEEDLAEYFAKIYIAPKAVAIYDDILQQREIEYRFELGELPSLYLSGCLTRRINSRGRDFFEPYEKEYLDLRVDYINNKDGGVN